MRVTTLCACLLVASTLFVLAGCKKARSKTADVAITNCVATPDTVPVHEGDQVHWQPGDQHDYTIRFSNPGEPTSNPFRVTHSVSNAAHLIRGHTGCTPEDNGAFYCKYSLIRDSESTPCADPGVRIIP
jgi:plastocyanin